MAIDVVKFIDSSDYNIFPSSNATGQGKITAEKNVQNIIGRLQIKSFKSDATDFALLYDTLNEELSIAPGKANINGYWFELTDTAIAPLTLTTDGDYNIKLGLVYDNNDLLAPDESGKSVCIKLIAEIEATEPLPEYLWLGTIVKDGSSYDVTTTTTNIHAISLDAVVGPDGTGTLEEYLLGIPDEYVSKTIDDTKHGALVFTDLANTQNITIDPDEPKVSVKTISSSNYKEVVIDQTGITGSNTVDTSAFTVKGTKLTVGDKTLTNKFEFDTSSIKTTATQIELPYATYFGPTGIANTKNLKVEIGNNNEAPIINAPSTNLQLSSNGGNGTVLVNGNFTVTKDIHANRVYNAVFNGFGEIFRKDKNEVIDYGDLVCVGPDGLIHKFNEELYSKHSIIGVCSDTIGFMLGGEDIPEDERVEVELVGQIWVKTHDTDICPGAMMAINGDGTIRKTRNETEKFGIALTPVTNGKVRILYNGR